MVPRNLGHQRAARAVVIGARGLDKPTQLFIAQVLTDRPHLSVRNVGQSAFCLVYSLRGQLVDHRVYWALLRYSDLTVRNPRTLRTVAILTSLDG